MSEKLGKALYGAAFAIGLPALLVLWARAAAPNVGLPAVASPAGWSVAAAGLALVLWGMAALAVFGRGLPMNAYPPPVFVARGPYAVVAHPIYLGFVILCAGAAVGAGSAAGLWLVTPVVALGSAALVLGYEGPEIAARFTERPRTFLRLPAGTPESPSVADRLSAYALVLVPWLILYEAVQALGVAPDAVALRLPGEAGWPVWESTELVYASTYLFVALAPLAAVSRAELRRFMVRGWAAIALVVFLWLVLPVAAPPRPFTPHGPLGALLDFERRLDSPACAFPSFHVVWAFLAASVWAARAPRARGLAWGWAWAIGASCLTTGMHTVADVAAGLAAAFLVLRLPRVWEVLRAAAERLANSWREWDFGAVRVINHGGWAALGTLVGVGLAAALAGGRGVEAVLLVAFSGLVGAALWAQFVEGSPRLLRPYGFYGGLLGVVLGAVLAKLLLGTDAWVLVGAFAVAGPWIQAAGRVRCLVQGCCHGAPAPESVGIRYMHPRSRVCRLANLEGVPVHPTPLYSILWNAVPAFLGARLWAARAPLPVIVGAYLILTGLGRFVEESRRGEPQTPVFARLRLYQWIAAGTVAAGAVLTCLPASVPTPVPEASLLALAAGAAFALATWFALGVDFPRSNRRFARLV
ncbi:MAG TPA: prolipoprotein diacylglyceryl transferase family protein [Thermoanaerobaculia bacterium]|jgi:protein-S-isoprenylcysteine O-methyltransferase Ste14